MPYSAAGRSGTWCLVDHNILIHVWESFPANIPFLAIVYAWTWLAFASEIKNYTADFFKKLHLYSKYSHLSLCKILD